MSKTLPDLPALNDVADNDLLVIEDVSAGATKKITRQKLLTGVIVQEAMAQFNDVSTGTTTIPKDNTLPQSNEGTSFMTLDFTPRYADSTIVVEVVICAGYSTTDDLIAALFKDGGTDAVAASAQGGAANAVRCIKLGFSEPAASAVERTYAVRVGGAAAGTVTFNGAAGARLFGAITKSYIRVTERAG